ncbi:PREDICTED: TMV resistance protein N-like [Tarenaya hassleriana]|uniref:TMV resistance protein N-like n=1 Tax=Tarenaya hassleriana TaxID=28532 RepID=UPI00053C4454|nr:PREDICTED: TMV resistance protein N-like [Tarenaya hassleriana]
MPARQHYIFKLNYLFAIIVPKFIPLELKSGMGEREERIREGWNYDVFLSFRGPDVKVAFLSHLYSALKRCGIYTFLDEELSRGAEIRLNLLEAIESSKILVVVLSKRYASSTWCLEELEHIMYCRRSRSEQLVLPIFYDIDPSHVRRHRGAVGEALSRHETRFPLDKVQRWRLALTEVADLSGYVWNGQRSEAKLIEDITRDILQRLDSSYLHLPSYHVGIRSRVQHILPLLSIGSDDVQVIGIGGMGGIGKTTIAKAVYNEVSHHFEGTSFLADFRKYSKNPEGKVHLKKKLLSDILKRYDITLNSIDHALKERFRRKRVLVIFDDVDDLSHFTSLGIEMSWFSRGSRIIITSRDLHLLEQLGASKIYIPEELNTDGCGLCPDIGLSELTGRCLIEVQDNKLMMHDLIRDMGRFIVKEKSPKNCGKRSRLWDADDVIDVLTKYSGTEKVEGLSLNAQPPDMESLDAKALSNMRELRLLQLNRVQLKGSYANFPKGLRWLCWHGFPFKFIPAEFFQRNLAVMDMHYSNLRRFWNAGEPWYLRKLKYLDLSNSFYLIETPDFSNLPNLKKLLLVNCKSLVLVHMSIGVLHGKLVFVNLNGCTELEDLPSEFYRLKSLETLNLSGCSKLKKLEDGLGEMEALTTLLADDAGIKEVPASIIQLKKLKNLSLGGSHNDYGMHSQTTCRLPVSFNGLSCLTTLRLSYCGLSDELIPEDFLSLSCLEDLDLRGNPFRNLLTDFARLPKLLILRLDNCSELRSMYSLPRSLKFLHATNCISLERTPDLSECSTLQGLFLSNCTNLIQTPGLDRLKTVRVIRIEMCMRIPVSFRESSPSSRSIELRILTPND